jgi:hypothetical protein
MCYFVFLEKACDEHPLLFIMRCESMDVAALTRIDCELREEPAGVEWNIGITRARNHLTSFSRMGNSLEWIFLPRHLRDRNLRSTVIVLHPLS